MTRAELQSGICSRLATVSGDLALSDARTICEFLFDCSHSQLHLSGQQIVLDTDAKRADAIIDRMLTGEPLPYVLGRQYFYNHFFAVTSDTLIPRPDTETIVELILKNFRQDRCFFLDLCTGSGNIAGALCLERPDWKSFAIDSSLPATRIAHHNLGTAVTVVCGDLFTPFKPHPVFDFIVSNPPYIPSTIIKTLDSSVKDWEPHSALDGSDDGVLFYRAIAKNAGSYLKDGGLVYCEIGYDQAESVSDIFKTLAWENIHIYKDLGGNTRVVCAQKRQPTTSGG